MVHLATVCNIQPTSTSPPPSRAAATAAAADRRPSQKQTMPTAVARTAMPTTMPASRRLWSGEQGLGLDVNNGCERQRWGTRTWSCLDLMAVSHVSNAGMAYMAFCRSQAHPRYSRRPSCQMPAGGAAAAHCRRSAACCRLRPCAAALPPLRRICPPLIRQGSGGMPPPASASLPDAHSLEAPSAMLGRPGGRTLCPCSTRCSCRQPCRRGVSGWSPCRMFKSCSVRCP